MVVENVFKTLAAGTPDLLSSAAVSITIISPLTSFTVVKIQTRHSV